MEKHCYKWQRLSNATTKDFPAMRNKHAVCVNNGAMYVYGGRDNCFVYNDLWKYHLNVRRWEKLRCTGDIPRLLQEHSLSSYQNKLYVFGGQFVPGTAAETPLWILDLETLIWQKPPPESNTKSPGSRRGHSAVTYGNQMLIYGGYLDTRGSTSELWSFNFDTEVWSLMYSCPSSDSGPGRRHGHTAVVYNNWMWVVGGMRDLTALRDMWKWDLKKQRWRKVRYRDHLPEIHSHTACVLQDDMIIIGGEAQWALQNTVWRFNFKRSSWHKLNFNGLGPSGRSHHACVVVPNIPSTVDEDDSLSNVDLSLYHAYSRSVEDNLDSHSITDASDNAPLITIINSFSNQTNNTGQNIQCDGKDSTGTSTEQPSALENQAPSVGDGYGPGRLDNPAYVIESSNSARLPSSDDLSLSFRKVSDSASNHSPLAEASGNPSNSYEDSETFISHSLDRLSGLEDYGEVVYVQLSNEPITVMNNTPDNVEELNRNMTEPEDENSNLSNCNRLVEFASLSSQCDLTTDQSNNQEQMLNVTSSQMDVHEPRRRQLGSDRPTNVAEFDYPSGMAVILCGGKEADRSTCDILPMAMWKLECVSKKMVCHSTQSFHQQNERSPFEPGFSVKWRPSYQSLVL